MATAIPGSTLGGSDGEVQAGYREDRWRVSYEVHRLSEPLERARKAKLAAYRKLGSRIRKWLGEHGTDRRRRFSLSPEEAKLVHDALAEIQRGSELSQVPWFDLELALHRLYLEKGPRALARAMGFSTGKRRSSQPASLVVRDYLLLQGLEPFRGIRRLVPHPWPDEAGGVPAEPPLSSVDALKTVAEKYRFNSASACRQFLVRERTRLKRNRRKYGEQRGSLVDDFEIPNPAKLKK